MPQDTKEQASETHDTRRQIMWINLDYATVATAMPLLMESGHPAMAKIAEAIQQRLDEQNDSIVGADQRTGSASCDSGADLTFDAAPVVTTGDDPGAWAWPQNLSLCLAQAEEWLDSLPPLPDRIVILFHAHKERYDVEIESAPGVSFGVVSYAAAHREQAEDFFNMMRQAIEAREKSKHVEILAAWPQRCV